MAGNGYILCLMPRATLQDRLPLTTREKTPEGFMRGLATLTRIGPIEYDAAELGVGTAGRKVKLFRTPESVFHQDTQHRLSGATLTREHPRKGSVTANDWREVAVGMVLDAHPVGNEMLGGSIIVNDAAAVNDLEQGYCEVSVGYTVEVQPVLPGSPGSDVGCEYYTEGPMNVNHAALVRRGRAGETVRVLDSAAESAEKEVTMPPEPLTQEQLNQQLNEFFEKMRALPSQAATAPAPSAGQSAADQVMAMVQDAASRLSKPDTGAPPVSDLGRMLTDAMAPMATAVEAMTKQNSDRLAAEDKARAEAAERDLNAQREKTAEEAAAKLVQETRTEERRRYQVLTDAMPLISEAQRAAVQEGSIKDILVAAVGEAVPNAAERSEDYLQGIMEGIRRERANVPTGVPQLTDSRAAGSLTARETAHANYVKSLADAYKVSAGAGAAG